MAADAVNRLEFWAGANDVAGVVLETRQHLESSPAGTRLAQQLADHLSAFNSTGEVVPYFGDYRLAYTEAFYQLKNSVCLAYHGFYSQAFATLRSVCELSLLQASLPEGDVVTDETLDLLQSMMPPGQAIPQRDEVNLVLPFGFGATQTPASEATTLAEWAIQGCRTPHWKSMRARLLTSSVAREYDSATQMSARIGESVSNLDPYVHARGHLRSATGLSAGNVLRFSEESFSQYATRMMCTAQVSLGVLMLAFLPTATSCPEAAAGFIDTSDLYVALSVLPAKDAEFFRAIYDGRGA